MPLPKAPATHYVNNGGAHIAYQVAGDGPIDLVFVMGWVTHMDYFWLEPSFARFLSRLASFSRLILVDKRGQGLSDRGGPVPTFEERMDDLRAVLDAVDSKRAALMGHSEGGALAILFAATHPDRTTKLVLAGTAPRWQWAPDWPWARTQAEIQHFVQTVEQGWGTPEWAMGDAAYRAPSLAGDVEFARWWGTYLRMGASPGTAIAVTRMVASSDVSHVLPSIHVPTLIVHRAGDRVARVEAGRYMARKIPGARYVELSGDDHLVFVGNHDEILQPVEEFLGASRSNAEPDTILATALATEIDNSTQLMARLGEHDWRNTRESYSEVVRNALAAQRGRAVSNDGDRLLAIFDGPSRAIRCAQTIVTEAVTLGLQTRAGLHTGECEMVDGECGGLPLRVAAWVMSHARPGEVLSSNTVRDLVAGSGIVFDDSDVRPTAPGPGGTWRLFRVEPRITAGTSASAGVRSRAGEQLTQREREVVALLARGRTNREIADALVISERTVENHVSNVLAKLSLESRAQVAIWALQGDDVQTRRSA